MSRVFLRSLFVFDSRPVAEIEAEVRDELDAHLAMIEDELLAQGLSPQQARVQALARFGDPARIALEARTIKLGDRIMLQRINLALLVVFGAAVIFLLVQNHRINTRSVATLEQVSASLVALQNREPAPQAAPASPAKLVYIEGAVRSPGPYLIPPGGFTLKQLISAAGGLKDGAQTIYLDSGGDDRMNVILSPSNMEAWYDYKLQPDDVVTVSERPDPRAPHRIHVSVQGYVNHPCDDWIESSGAVLAKLLNGKWKPDKRATRVVIRRAGGGPEESFTVAEALSQQGLTVRINAGDVIHVLSPEADAEVPSEWRRFVRTPRLMELARGSRELMYAIEQREAYDNEYESLIKRGFPIAHGRVESIRKSVGGMELQIAALQVVLLKDRLMELAQSDQELRDLLERRAEIERTPPTSMESDERGAFSFLSRYAEVDRAILARYEELTGK